jgi:hypothetical protein
VTASPALTAALQRQVTALEADLRVRVDTQPAVRDRWTAEHATALERGRTAASWQAWRDERVTQAAVSWVLATVFVVFCEDNALVRPVWIAGPDARRQEALDAQLAYFREHPEHTDREWLQQAVSYLAGRRATAGLVDEHSPLHMVSPSGDAATVLLGFWRSRGEDGRLVHDLADPTLSTRFLGDLYQDLSQFAKDFYALLQTPEFVEEFILDRTLDPALAERPLDGFKLIDPTCGSGHFLLGAFARLLDRWNRQAPGLETQARVQTALDAIHGVDLNPFAVAIARFRLTIAALQACGLRRLEDAPAFKFHLAVGDSLLHGSDQYAIDYGAEYDSDARLSGFTYVTEDLAVLREILQPQRYDVVVGNPPYIAVMDPSLRKAYRSRFRSCVGKWTLVVPFMERFFQLARYEDRPGWVGKITGNAFMKREFGAKLVENFLARIDLRIVVDCSGVYLPGYGTPTVILVGTPRKPSSAMLRAVLGIRGEPETPVDPAKGNVWSDIREHIDEPGHDGRFVSVVNLEREWLATHPWVLAGGGAIELLKHLRAGRQLLKHLTAEIGIAAVTGEDDFYMLRSNGAADRLQWISTLPLVEGDLVRNWGLLNVPIPTGWPYDAEYRVRPLSELHGLGRWLKSYKSALDRRRRFGVPMVRRGLAWYEWQELYTSKLRTPWSIAWAEVATHNHFILDRDRKLFKNTAPVIKLPEGANEELHLALLGLLNSSTVCFWLKQVCHNKGGPGGGSSKDERWRDFYQFNGTNVGELPLPATLPVSGGRLLDSLASELARYAPPEACARGIPSRELLDLARVEYRKIRARMIAVQEELDWEVYRLYSLIPEDLTYLGDDLPGLHVGERAFEIVLAQQQEAGNLRTRWFSDFGERRVADVPQDWPEAYVKLVRRRVELIRSERSMILLENPNCKRPWERESWEGQEETALRGWLLDRLEDRRLWFDRQGRPAPRSVAQLADEMTRDADVVSVLTLWEGRPDVPVARSLERLLPDDAVPFLAAHRYKASGLRKRRAWEDTWDLQRRDDAGEKVGTIPVPPKYTSADFARTSYWQHRGKLDVPKERFIFYPGASRDTDPTQLLGWAGWDHAQQALALNLVIQQREADGWDDARLVPLIAGLAELQPWVDQWHAEVDPTYGVSLAAFCREQLTARAAQVGKTLDELAAWRPEPARRGRRSRNTGASA